MRAGCCNVTMPPKNRSIDDFIEALSEPRVLEALAKALAPFITKTLDAYIATRLDGLSAQLDELKAVNSDLQTEVTKQNHRIDELEAFSRSDNLIIRGLPELSAAERATDSADGASVLSHHDTNKSVESTFISFCKDSLNVAVSPQDISIAHRLKAGPKDSARPILVRFTTRRIRNEVFHAKKLLKGASSRMFISEHLTKNAAELFFEARRMLREKKIYGTWTQNGLVHVKFSSNPATRADIIRCKSDLNLRP